jgi:uncharacterized ion transporter superfamily protein YfcC
MDLWWFRMVEEKKSGQSNVKNVAFRVVKATLRVVVVYLLYFFLAPLLAPIFKLVPGFAGTIETFVVVFIVLMVLGDLAERTIFQCFFSTARSLFVIAYLILSLGDGIINVGFENFSLSVNLTMFCTIAVLLSLLGLARSVLQAINFMNERAESSIQT